MYADECTQVNGLSVPCPLHRDRTQVRRRRAGWASLKGLKVFVIPHCYHPLLSSSMDYIPCIILWLYYVHHPPRIIFHASSHGYITCIILHAIPILHGRRPSGYATSEYALAEEVHRDMHLPSMYWSSLDWSKS
jgi:hypothetical protein